MRPSRALISEAWRNRRLRLAGLPPAARLLALAALIAAGAASTIVLLAGFGATLASGSHRFSAWGEVDRATIVVGYLGFGAAAAAAAGAALASSARFSRATLAFVGLAGAMVGAHTAIAGHDLAQLNEQFAVAGEPLYHNASPLVPKALGYLGVATALLVALLPLRVLGRSAWLGPALAVAPFVLSCVAYVTADATRLPDAFVEAKLPQSPQAAIGQSVIAVGVGLALWFGALLYWQVIVAARAARDSSIAAARLLGDVPALLFGLLVVKVVWIAAGLLDLLPDSLGGGAELWDAARSDGLLAWLVAVAAAATAGWWLARPRKRPVPERSLTAPAVVVIGGMMLVPVAATLLVMLAQLEALVRELGLLTAAEPRAAQAADWAAGQALRAQAAFIAVALFAGAALLRLRQSRVLGLFLVAFAAWALPRAIHTALGSEAASSDTGSLERVTLDAVLTATVLALALLGRLGRQRGAGTGDLLVVLLASTLVTYAGETVSLFASEYERSLFFVLLVAPVVYQFLFDSEPFNEPNARRTSRVLLAAATAAAVLTAVAVRQGAGVLEAGDKTEEDVGRVLFLVPFAALLVASALSRPTTAIAVRPRAGGTRALTGR